MTPSKMPLVVLISGNGSNLQAIIDAIHDGRIHGEIRAVISNSPRAYGLERARQAGIPARVVDHRDFDDREAFDRELARVIDGLAPDLVVMAGFMRILTEGFVDRYHGRLINIHPSLLPRYRGLDTHARALTDGATEHGASVHFVTPELDAGPVIIQARIPVRDDDTPETLQKRVHAEEHHIYPQAVAWFAEGRLRLGEDGVHFDDRRVSEPAILDDDRLHLPVVHYPRGEQ